MGLLYLFFFFTVHVILRLINNTLLTQLHKVYGKKQNWFQCCLKFTSINGYEADPGGRAMCGRSIAVTADSKPAEGMDVRLLCLLCVV